MARVNIVTTTTAKGPGKQECVGGLLIEEVIKGKSRQCERFLYREHITKTELTLQLLANAITIVERAENDYESIEIYTDVPMVTNAFENKWIDSWHENDWHNAKGEEVKNLEEWKFLWKHINPIVSKCIFVTGHSRWTGLLMSHCERELEKVINQRMVDENIKKIEEKLDHGNDKR